MCPGHLRARQEIPRKVTTRSTSKASSRSCLCLQFLPFLSKPTGRQRCPFVHRYRVSVSVEQESKSVASTSQPKSQSPERVSG